MVDAGCTGIVALGSLGEGATLSVPEKLDVLRTLAKDPAVLAEVQHEYELGQKVHINSTPTVVITYKLKQQPWSEWSSYPLFKSYVDDLLKR